MSESNRGPKANSIEYWCWLVLAITYAAAFFQRVSPQIIVDYLAVDFNTSAKGVGTIAAAYFIGYTIMQFPAGIMIDVYGVRPVILVSLALSTVGSLLFSSATTLPIAYASRALIAVGDALVFTCLIKYAASVFSDARFGLMSALSQVSGYLGGILATAPLAVTVTHFGWRTPFWMMGVVSLCSFIFLAFFLSQTRHVGGLKQRIIELLSTAKKELYGKASWGCALTFAGHFAAVTTLSGVWGVSLLTTAYGQSREQASSYMMGFMIATIVGSIIFGYYSDRTKSLFRLLMVSGIGRMLLFALLAPGLVAHLGNSSIWLTLVMLGVLAGGAVPLVLKSLKKIYAAKHIGLGGALNASISGLVMVAIQPILGAILDSSAVGRGSDGMPLYSLEGYNLLITGLVAVSSLGVIGPLLMRARIINE